MELLRSILDQVTLTAVIDIGITALLIYWLFSLIRGTRAVRLVIGVSVLIVVYALRRRPQPVLLTRILQGGAVVGLFALVVVFQPELRRALERIGRVGLCAWLSRRRNRGPSSHVAIEVARAAAACPRRVRALIVIERETGLEEVAETGVMIHGDCRPTCCDDLRAADGRSTTARSSSATTRSSRPVRSCPSETTIHTERFGTRHRAALGIAEQTDAMVVVVSEENGQISLVERSRIVRNLNELQLADRHRATCSTRPAVEGAFGWRPSGPTARAAGARDSVTSAGSSRRIPTRQPTTATRRTFRR